MRWCCQYSISHGWCQRYCIVKTLDRTRFVENGGDIDLTVSWIKSLLKRMNFMNRRATTKCGIPPQVKTEFLQNVIDVVQMEEIPSQLILNWDQTGIHSVPTSNWTMASKMGRNEGI